MKIAVIGAGISGITAAYLIQKKHHVTLYEKNDYFGGHTNTVVIPDGPDQGTPVDTGFIVLNSRTYPNFIQLLSRLNVKTLPTDMSFGYYCKQNGLAYASQNLNALFAQRKNIVNIRHWRFVYDMARFIRETRSDYLAGRISDITLGQYAEEKNFGDDVMQQFVIPMAAAIWSGSDFQMMKFPMKTFAQFYENHGLLSVSNHPPWYFVKGGSHTYVTVFLKTFAGKAINNLPVKSVRRSEEGVTIRHADDTQKNYDQVIIATHADEAYQLLEDPSPDERRLLQPWTYSLNQTYLHTDSSLMPPNKRAWASWNYSREIDDTEKLPVTVTYHMNRLQKLNTSRDYFVTLNPRNPIPGKHIIRQIAYTHPQYSFDAFATQKSLGQLNGQRSTYFCGSYFGYGFHEDGVTSGIEVAKHFGLEL